MPANKFYISTASVLTTLLLSGCMSSEAGYSEQQKRMLRCDQYLGETREECLRGMAVTIEDYKTDWREFERSEKQKREAQAIDLKAQKPVDEKPIEIIEEPPKPSS